MNRDPELTRGFHMLDIHQGEVKMEVKTENLENTLSLTLKS